jgi:hypothetical protein
VKNRVSLSLAAIRPLGFVLVSLFSAAVAEASASRWATLEAIHKIENPRNSPRPGRYGELGAYQFRATTWRMHTRVPFARAIDRSVSDDVAVKHYEWIKHGLEAALVPATPYNIALAWNSGLSAAITGRSPGVSHNYAERVVNLAMTYDRSRLVASAN